jgi:selenide,water dikinase
VRDPEIKFGYAITGLIDPARILTNAGGRAGDAIVLTKPLGTGIVATALKAGHAPADAVAAATGSMARLNREAAEAALRRGVRAATDITGFGLAGHASAVARESGLTLEIRAGDLPLLPHAAALAPRYQPAGLKANRKQFEPGVEYRSDPGEPLKALLYDPQTSGGLFLLVPPEEVQPLLADLPGARPIGHARAASGPRLVFT